VTTASDASVAATVVAAVFFVISPVTVVVRLECAGSVVPSDGALVTGFAPASLALVPLATGIVSATGGDGVVTDLNFIV
jgi:hypothetical protein